MLPVSLLISRFVLVILIDSFQQIFEEPKRTEKHQEHFAASAIDGQLKPTTGLVPEPSSLEQCCRGPPSLCLSKSIATKYKSTPAHRRAGTEQQNGIQHEAGRADRLEHFEWIVGKEVH